MKLRLERSGMVLEFEHTPMAPKRFEAVVKLAELAIGGAVLLGAVHMVGFWVIPWAVGAYVLTGVYRILREEF